MSDVLTMGAGVVAKGDEIRQVAPIGLGAMWFDSLFVLEVLDNELKVSETPDGPPLVDGKGQLRLLPRMKFQKVFRTAA